MNKRLIGVGFILCMALLFLNLNRSHVQAIANQAELNGEPYEDLETALYNVTEGDTIKLLDNIVLDVPIFTNDYAPGISFTINLNGKTVSATGSNSAICHDNGALLTIFDSLGGGKITSNSDWYTVSITNSSDLTLSGVTVEHTNTLNGKAISSTSGKLIMRGGTVQSLYKTAIYNESGNILIQNGNSIICGGERAMNTPPNLSGYSKTGITVSMTKTDGTETFVIDRNGFNEYYKYFRFDTNMMYSATPMADTTTVTKSSPDQESVSFTLTNSPQFADNQSWKVYTNATSSTQSAVSATNIGNTLTLTYSPNIFPATFYLSVTEPGKEESPKLALTVNECEFPREATPTSATFTATGPADGTLSGVSAEMKVYIEGRGWINLTSTANLNLSGLEPCDILVVKKGNGTSTSDSLPQIITITKATKPELTATQPSRIGEGGSIPMTVIHEYEANYSGTWKDAVGTTTFGAFTNYIKVRVKAAGTMLASEPQLITLTAFTGTKEATPNATFTATGPSNGTLSGVTDGMKYRINFGAWTDITSDANIDLTGLSTCYISVVKKGDGSLTTDSNEQTITVTRAETPALVATQPNTIGGSGSIPMTAVHEYSSDLGITWESATGTTTLASGTYRVRVKAEGAALASAYQTITLTAFTGTKEATPSVTFTAIGVSSGNITGVTDGMKYRIDDGEWYNITSNADILLTPLTACTISVIKKGNGSSTIDSDAQTITVTQAATPTLTEAQPNTIGGSGSIPMTEVHEYKSGSGSWISASGTTTLTPGTYLVRVKSVGTVLASANQSITLTAFTGTKEATPSATFTATGPNTGTLSGVTNGMKYQIDSGAWTDITSGADINLTSLAPCTIQVVKKGNGSTTTDSDAQTIAVTKAATPVLTEAQPNTIGGNGSIPMTAVHEYSSDSITWSNATGTTTLTPGTYLVRVKSVGTVLASENQTITLTAFTGTKEATPNATFTAIGVSSGNISGVINGMKYRIDDGEWCNITSSADRLLTPLTACTITVIMKGNGSSTIDSDAQTITVTQAATPTLTPTQPNTIGGSGSIPMTEVHEYKSGSGSWINASGTTTLTPGTYLVRVKSVGMVLASANQSITLTAFTGTKEATPNATFTATGPDTGTLSGVSDGMKYRIDSGVWTDITSDADRYLTGLAPCNIQVVKKGNGSTTTDSDAQTITVTKAANPALTPTQPNTIGGNGSIPMTTLHEYKSSTGSTWSTASGTTTLAPGTYLVRVKATGTELASANQSITIIAYSVPSVPGGGGGSPAPAPASPDRPEGTVEKDKQQEDGAPAVNLNNSNEELKTSVLTPEEQEIVAKGENAKIILKVTNISASVSEEEKKLIQDKLAAENGAVGSGASDISVLFVDLTLYKQIGNQEQSKVTETNSKISISLEVPEEFRNTDATKNRAFYVVRIHDGQVTRIEGSYDADKHLFTFETDRFSTYALTYQDISRIQTYQDFHHLQLKAKADKTSQTLSYKRAVNVDGYLIYGGKCGEEMTKLTELPANTTSFTVKNLKQGTNYKYQVKAYRLIDGEQVIIMTSKVIHSITEGKTYADPIKVTTDTASVKLETGKSKTVICQVILQKDKKLKEHTAVIRYETSNKEIATVNSKGKITAKAKGTCYVYAYAQNGVYKKIKVTVE